MAYYRGTRDYKPMISPVMAASTPRSGEQGAQGFCRMAGLYSDRGAGSARILLHVCVGGAWILLFLSTRVHRTDRNRRGGHPGRWNGGRIGQVRRAKSVVLVSHYIIVKEHVL